MKHVSIQTQSELLNNLNLYKQANTKGREPDKDFIFDNYINRITTELSRRSNNEQEEKQ